MKVEVRPAAEARPRMLFVSPRFLFPVDSGGKIRTTQILRGLKGGHFSVRLALPATPVRVERHRAELEALCDELSWWPEPARDIAWKVRRLSYLASRLPIPVRSDWSAPAERLVHLALADRPDVVVFDFLHSVVLAPESIACPSVLFTHNVETEIFARHAAVATGFLRKRLWSGQAAKMQRFESATLRRFDVVVAVSERDAQAFRISHPEMRTAVIPTGVDLDYFSFHEPVSDNHLVFCGSMDWLANQEAMNFFLETIWDCIVREVPDARLTVIGRAPPASLIEKAARRGANWTFTGYVDDVRPYMKGAAVSVIPMRVGGGTRLKVYEAMAAGTPIVSTTVGVEGLPIVDGTQYLRADEPPAFAQAVVSLLKDSGRRKRMAAEARALVEGQFSYTHAARVFEEAARLAIHSRGRG